MHREENAEKLYADRFQRSRNYARDAAPVTSRQVAFDRVRFFGERLSENIAATPEGYLICRNSVIGRSGPQVYKVGELADPDGLLGDRDPNEDVRVWRDPSEVFSPATLSSFEGKTFALDHPDKLLGPSDEKYHHEGHLQNVRQGSEPLQSGDWPMLADIVVTGADAIRAIEAGSRELSCGYSYKLARNGGRLEQTNILGNHVALVDRGRAGAEARINDSAPNWTAKRFRFQKRVSPPDLELVESDEQIYARAGRSHRSRRILSTSR